MGLIFVNPGLLDEFSMKRSSINTQPTVVTEGLKTSRLLSSESSEEKLLEEWLDRICEHILKMLESSRSRELETSSAMDPWRDFLTTDGKLLHKLFELVSEYSARISQISLVNWQFFLNKEPLLGNGQFKEACEEPPPVVVYAVVVSTLSLLSIVYQYLLGYVLKGGTTTYSSGSLDFRETFVSLLLFQGSYVWIFFRDVAPKRTVYQRSKKDEAGRVIYYGKYEPRFKPHREKLPGDRTIKFDYLSLGGYDSELDAKIVCQIAGFYYTRDEGRIQLRNGSYFNIPPMPDQELFGKEKAKKVAARAKEVFRDFQLMNNAIILPSESNAVGVRDFFQHVVREEFTFDALLDAAGAHPVDRGMADSWCAVGEGLEGTVTSPSSADLNSVDNLVAVGEGSGGTPASPSDAEQVVLRMERPQSLDAGSLAKLGISIQELKEQLEAERNQRISEHEQHLQREKQLEERISQLELEKEERNSKLQLEDEYVRSFLC
jgi:hypothetical protein